MLSILLVFHRLGTREGISFNRLLQATGLSAKVLESYIQRMKEVLEVEEGIFKDWKGKPATKRVVPKVSIIELDTYVKSYEEFLTIHKRVLND